MCVCGCGGGGDISYYCTSKIWDGLSPPNNYNIKISFRKTTFEKLIISQYARKC